MPEFIVRLSQMGHGTLEARVLVTAETEEDAREAVFEADIDWKVQRFSGEGYEIEDVEQLT